LRSITQIGLKITAATREYYRYTGPSAELERRGAGTSRPELAWAERSHEQLAESTQTLERSDDVSRREA